METATFKARSLDNVEREKDEGSLRSSRLLSMSTGRKFRVGVSSENEGEGIAFFHYHFGQLLRARKDADTG